jgi:hypothetical protein
MMRRDIAGGKISGLVQSAYEMIPPAIVMAAPGDPSDLIHFGVLTRVDSQLVKQCYELRWKYAPSRHCEIPATGKASY